MVRFKFELLRIAQEWFEFDCEWLGFDWDLLHIDEGSENSIEIYYSLLKNEKSLTAIE